MQFLKGYIEVVPLPDNRANVIISNCVINLAADKRPVLRAAFWLLKRMSPAKGAVARCL